MNIDFKTAAAYIRVSTDRQTELSPESQLTEIRKYAKLNGYIVPNEFIFRDEGISGTKAAKRPGFQNMIGVAKQKDAPFSAILVWKFSRFARNQEEAIVYKSMLKKNGVSVISVSEPMDDSPYSSLIERIIEWMDEYYSIRLSGEVKRGMNAKIAKGQPVNIAPFGYIIKDKKLVIDESKANIIRKIYEHFISGAGYRSIAICLNNEGVLTNRGKKWDNYAVRYILSNPTYVGKLHYRKDNSSQNHFDFENSKIVDGIHEPIITEQTFKEAQEIIMRELNNRRRYIHSSNTVKNQYMLHGLLRCASCGASMVYLARNSGNRQPALRCCNYVHAKCPHSQSVTLPVINSAVLTSIEHLFASADFHLDIRSKLPELHDNTNEINRNRQKLRRIKEAYEDGVYTLEEFKQSKVSIEQRISELIAQQQTEELSDEAAIKKEFINKNKKLLSSLKSSEISEQEKNEMLSSFVDHINWDKSANTVEIYFYL